MSERNLGIVVLAAIAIGVVNLTTLGNLMIMCLMAAVIVVAIAKSQLVRQAVMRFIGLFTD